MKRALAGMALTVLFAGGTVGIAHAGSRPRPAANCTNASAQMAQLAAEGRALDAQRAQLRAAELANLLPLNKYQIAAGLSPNQAAVRDQQLADQLFVQTTAVANKQQANSQARGDLSRACNIPFVL